MFKVHSIFSSIDGEVNSFHQGRVTTFVRFFGCNLEKECEYCDTKYANKEYSEFTSKELYNEVAKKGIKKVTITGGEPLLQPKEDMYDFLKYLKNRHYDISIETNGTRPVYNYMNWVDSFIIDYKLFDTTKTYKWNNINHDNPLYSRPQDIIKFIIGSKKDYLKAVEAISQLKSHGCKCQFALSPMHGIFDPAVLIDWCVKDKLNVIINIQIHKYIELKEDTKSPDDIF